MEALEILLCFLLVFFFLRPARACERHCTSLSDGPDVHFPFYIVNDSSSAGRCGFGQEFALSCKNSQPVLNLPAAGDFVVHSINYEAQTVRVEDPDGCLPRRLLNFSLLDSPFEIPEDRKRSIRLFGCNLNRSTDPHFVFMTSRNCVNGSNYAIVPVDESDDGPVLAGEDYLSRCREIKTVPVSLRRGFREDRTEMALELSWDKPDCRSCEENGETCGYKRDTVSEVGCSKSSSHGIPRSAKYGLIIGVGIPGLLCLIGLSCFVCSKIQAHTPRHRLFETGFEISIGPLPAMTTKGLDGATIESYPKTVLGESCRLSGPNDCTCPICLSEYEAKDTIRTIPECNHCFHVYCVDEWLKVNATCPVCRNSPTESSATTPCLSVSSSTLLLSSSSSSSSSPLPTQLMS